MLRKPKAENLAKPPAAKTANSSPTDTTETDSFAQEIERQIGDLVSQKQREVIVAKMTSLMVSEHFSGPIAHPRHLRAYEEISPGAADRIISMAEKQQSHHINMDEKILAAETSDRKLGMFLGAGAFIALIVCALFSAIMTDSNVIPGMFLGTAAIGGVSLFIRGRQNGNGNGNGK